MDLNSFFYNKIGSGGFIDMAVGGWFTALFTPYDYTVMLLASTFIIFATVLKEYLISRRLKVSSVLLCGAGCFISFALQPLLRYYLSIFLDQTYI